MYVFIISIIAITSRETTKVGLSRTICICIIIATYYDMPMTHNDILRPVYPYHGEGSDDYIYRLHYIKLIEDEKLGEIFPRTINREIMAMYLGIVSVCHERLISGMATMRVYNLTQISAVLMQRYGCSQRQAEDIISDTFGAFAESMPESNY